MSHDDYDIGYGKPPKATRFQKGRSGNPKGRPRGVPNAKTLIAKALSEKVLVRDNGKRRTISKAEAMVTQQVNKAAAGDPKAFAQLLPFLMQQEDSAASFPTPTDERFAQTMLQRLLAQRDAIQTNTVGEPKDDDHA